MSARVFDRWARSYDECALQPVFQAAHEAVLGRARHIATRPRRVLDVGCGTGRLLRTAVTLFPDAVLVGVDISRGMLTVAGHDASTIRRLGHIQAAAERLPFADRSFDLVVSTASFRHWADHGAAMREIRRVLAPGGLLGVADLLTLPRRGVADRLNLPRLGAPDRRGRRPDPPTAIGATLAMAGLHTVSVDAIDGFGPIPAITVVLARRTPSSPEPSRTALAVARPAPRAEPLRQASVVAFAAIAVDIYRRPS